MKKIYIFLSLIFCVFILVWCFGDNDKDLSFYKNLWQDTFKNYQNSVTKINKKWVFDFEFGVSVLWDDSEIDKFLNFNLESKFSNLWIKIFWEHDLENIENPNINATIKAFFNKSTFWLWDIDINLNINWNWDIEYIINNFNKDILKILQVSNTNIEAFEGLYKENKWKKIITSANANLIKEIFDTIQEKSKDSPLYKNSKEEEKAIIDKFLTNEVIEIISWKEQDDNITDISFNFNWDKFINFLNDVAKILKQNKNFNADKAFFNSFVVNWNLFIQNKNIINSNINAEFPLSIKDNSWKEKLDLLMFQNQFKMPNPENFNVNLKTIIFAKSSQNNKLQIELKGMIK